MSIANKLNWSTASKPKFGKATEHSGAKKGKGAWDRKKAAKKTSNKGRRAGGKQEIKDQTVGDESDGPFAGSAPLFKKAEALHWTTAEPRPCYPSEDPVEDHCNDSISPPAPGGGDDMEVVPYSGGPELSPNEPDNEYDGDQSLSPPPSGSEPYDWDQMGPNHPEWDETQIGHPDYSAYPPTHPYGSSKERDALRKDDEEEDRYLNEEGRTPQREDEDFPLQDDSPGGFEWSEDEGEDDAFDRGDDPMENAGPRKQEEEPLVPDEPVVEETPEQGKGKKGDFSQVVPRATFLSDDDPHQFWGQSGEHVQNALHKYVMPALQSPNPEVAAKAKEILMNGPKIGNYNKRDLADQMSDPKFYEGKSRQKVMRQVERDEGKPEGYLDAPTEDERGKMHDYFEFGGQDKGPVI